MTTDEPGEFQRHRPLLFSIAYRMLGSASDAEDVLQDAWLRYRDASEIRSPRAFATTIVTRLCLDRLKAARTVREQYVGPWLPEPVLTSGQAGPDVALQRAESVTFAFLVLLEALSPEERAVFILKEAFDYGHAEIAETLDLSEANSRQLLHRAKARLKEGRPRLTGTPASRRALAGRFVAALQAGDAQALTELLAQDVGLWTDGGGRVSAARRPLFGRAEVLNFLTGLHRVAVRTGVDARVSLTVDEVNGEPAVLQRIGGRLDTIYVVSIAGDAVDGLRIVRNPDKLRYIDRQLAGTAGRPTDHPG
jgi:RNA polymerase sigma-70 factor (ECF subfamily)